MRMDSSLGLIFFPTRPDIVINTPVWNTAEWGMDASTWKDWVQQSGYTHSVWGASFPLGATLLQEMSKSPRTVAVASFASELSQNHPPRDVRLFRRSSPSGVNNYSPVLSKLWVFAIMVLAGLFIVVGTTSLVMHFNQARMRRDLRRRIANGQVDLEMLGIKRQRVPQKIIERMPRYVYTSEDASHTSLAAKETTSSPHVSVPAQHKALPKRDVPFSQPTCPICLDDFTHDETVVRELPCQHIFHPECVDEFLRTSTSLCPICKKSALPAGFCPDNITIAMVRRERAMRRNHEPEVEPRRLSTLLPRSIHRFVPARLLQVPSRPRQGAEEAQAHQTVTAPPSDSENPNPPTYTAPTPPRTSQPSATVDLEMGTLEPTALTPTPTTTTELPPEIQVLSPEARREWGRQRLAAAIPSPGPAQAGEETTPTAQTGGFRRVFRRVFPT